MCKIRIVALHVLIHVSTYVLITLLYVSEFAITAEMTATAIPATHGDERMSDKLAGERQDATLVSSWRREATANT